MMVRWFAGIGALFGFCAVLFGAMLAHVLAPALSERGLLWFETGSRYLFFHTFALFVVAWGIGHFPSRWLLVSGWAFVAGVLLFSGSLFLLAWSGTLFWAHLTPVGGVLLLLGWGCLGWGILRSRL